MYGATSHFIDTNVYVIDGGITYSLYQSEKMSDTVFKFLRENDKDFSGYDFKKIQHIDIYVTNIFGMPQKIVMRLSGNKTRIFNSNFFTWSAPKSNNDKKFFNDTMLALLSIKQEYVDNPYTENHITQIKW